MLQTVDADVSQWEETETAGAASAETTAACGLSFFSSAAADAAATGASADAAMTACGSSFFSSAVADAAATGASADADATANHMLNRAPAGRT